MAMQVKGKAKRQIKGRAQKQIKSRLKKGDNVKVITGKDKNKTGKILSINYMRNRVLVEGVNIVKKTVRRKNQQDKGGIMSIEAAIHMSNVQILHKGKVSRIRYEYGEKNEKARIIVKTGEKM